ncbi:MAG: radical SAM protein [Selenomonadaceae bacterium]|nr:radical SAM protein [Selenomonadaceae bacterium]
MLYVNHREKSTKVLGPGRRYALWLQGCKKRCPFCINPQGQPTDSGGEWISIKKIWREIKSVGGLKGITVSGGEPFLQAEKLAELIKILREESNLDVMIFTGYKLEELQARQDESIDFLLANTDILIDGEYREELNTNSLYRGSDNQRIFFLTQKYLPFKEAIERTKSRNIEFVCREDGELFMIGVPPKNFDKKFMKKIFEEV